MLGHFIATFSFSWQAAVNMGGASVQNKYDHYKKEEYK